MFYYLYKIINKLNGKIYVGVHKTADLDDGYMGSGKILRLAIEKHGIENFEKEILRFFDSADEMFEAESVIVNEEFISRKDVYNIRIGGTDGGVPGTTNVKDKEGNGSRVSVNDPLFLSGELVGVSKNTVRVKDQYGNISVVSIDDERYLNGDVVFIWTGNKHQDITKEKISNALKGNKHFLGKTHSDETKHKMSLSKKENKSQVGNKNSQFGTCWIYNPLEKTNKKIEKIELESYIKNGWIKGRKIKNL